MKITIYHNLGNKGCFWSFTSKYGGVVSGASPQSTCLSQKPSFPCAHTKTSEILEKNYESQQQWG